MKEIENRADLSLLIHSFYDEIRANELLGPIFNSHIESEQWPAHLEKLTDFWETNLFGVPSFKGNPTMKHKIVDRNLNHSIEASHFEQWLEIWFATIDKLFEGPLANRAKYAAQRMASGQFNAVLHHRQA